MISAVNPAHVRSFVKRFLAILTKTDRVDSMA